MATTEALRPQRQVPLEQELADRVRWFVRLRWLAGGAVVAAAAATAAGWPAAWPWAAALAALGGAILLYNVGLSSSLRRVRPEDREALMRAACTQVGADLLALALLMHLTGGVASPLLLYFVFHIVIASFLLPRSLVVVQVALAATLVALVAVLEGSGTLPPTVMPWTQPGPDALRYPEMLTRWLAFTVGLGVAAFLSSSLADALRVREHRLVSIQRELAKAYVRLEDMENARLQFLLKITHSLRSPVAAIQGMARVIREGYAGEVSEQLGEMIERIDRRSEFLMQLVNDLLALAAQEQEITVGELVPVDLAALLARAVESVRGRAQGRGVNLDAAIPAAGSLVVSARQEDLERVVSELLENAVKYTPEGGQANLRVHAAGPGKCPHISCPQGAVGVEVADTGIGIPPEAQGRIFQEFFRAPNAKQVVEHGTGLGLAICRRISEEHRGTITLESSVGQGSRFTLWLPLAPV